jgi:hypothetical protein
MVLRAGAGLQVLVGLTLWSGHGYALVGMHRAIGMVFVLALWGIALLALAARRRPGLAAFVLLWGLAIAALGFTQQRILIGDLHWIVRVLHLALGLSAIPMAERLVARRGDEVRTVPAVNAA